MGNITRTSRRFNPQLDHRRRQPPPHVPTSIIIPFPHNKLHWLNPPFPTLPTYIRSDLHSIPYPLYTSQCIIYIPPKRNQPSHLSPSTHHLPVPLHLSRHEPRYNPAAPLASPTNVQLPAPHTSSHAALIHPLVRYLRSVWQLPIPEIPCANWERMLR